MDRDSGCLRKWWWSCCRLDVRLASHPRFSGWPPETENLGGRNEVSLMSNFIDVVFLKLVFLDVVFLDVVFLDAVFTNNGSGIAESSPTMAVESQRM